MGARLHNCPVDNSTEQTPEDFCFLHWRRLGAFQKLELVIARGQPNHERKLRRAIRYLNKQEAK